MVLCGTKNGSSMDITVKNLLSTFIFKSVFSQKNKGSKSISFFSDTIFVPQKPFRWTVLKTPLLS